MASWLMRMVASSGSPVLDAAQSVPDARLWTKSALPMNGPSSFPYHCRATKGDAVGRGIATGEPVLAPASGSAFCSFE
jgi:hypothetical protein